MAYNAGVHTLYAVVNPANAPVIHWMRKLGAKIQMRQGVYGAVCACDRRNVWCFPLPIPESWVANETVRGEIERSCKGENSIPESVKQHIQEDIERMKGL